MSSLLVTCSTYYFLSIYRFDYTTGSTPSCSKNMLLYQDILTGDEMFSDAFPMYVSPSYPSSLLTSPKRKAVEDIAYEVDCQMITIGQGADIDIGLSILSLPSTGLVIFSRKVPIPPPRSRRNPWRTV